MKLQRKHTPEKELDTPYKKAGQEWDNRMGSALVQAKSWRYGFFAMLLLIVFPSIGGLIYLGKQPKTVPVVVEVHDNGQTSYRGDVSKPMTSWQIPDYAIRYFLMNFVTETRSVSSDPGIIKKNWIDAYNYVTRKGSNTLSLYVQKNDPFVRSARERVSIDFQSINKVTDTSYQIDWKELKWGVQGEPIGETQYRGVFKVVIKPPTTEAGLYANPLGLLIDDMDISERL